MANGSWDVFAWVKNSSSDSNSESGGAVAGNGGGYANAALVANEDNVLSASSAANISGTGNDGKAYEDNQEDDF
ncbi:MAG: hypothetical protein OXU36_15250 [Candidatus Poribacteria bacterium]|nr:hypothetical protein [Candidatus Poribacteria bacterium]